MSKKDTITCGSVLVVDDDPMIQNLLSKILKRAGNQVNCASNADDALRICREQLPDVILLDLMMPGVDGFQLCGMLRDEFDDVPIIMITGMSDDSTCSKTISHGANDFLTKPINTGEVLIRVKNAMQMRHLQIKLEKQEKSLDVISGQYRNWADNSGEGARKELMAEFVSVLDDSDDDYDLMDCEEDSY